MLKRAADDKIAHVFQVSTTLLTTMAVHVLTTPDCHTTKGKSNLRMSDVQHVLEGLMPLLVLRLGDTNTRCRDDAATALLTLARNPLVGCNFVGNFLIKLPQKKKIPSKVMVARLQVLHTLVCRHGYVEGLTPNGIAILPLMEFVMNLFQSPHSDIRCSCVTLVGGLYSLVGYDVLTPFLMLLRPVQRELFEEEFLRHSDIYTNTHTHTHTHTHGNNITTKKVTAPSHTPTKSNSLNKSFSNIRVNTSEILADEATDVCEGSDNFDDELTCRFCRKRDESFTESGLEIHWWRDCPMLILCSACDQVVELQDLAEHRKKECGAANKFHMCSKCEACFPDVEITSHIERCMEKPLPTFDANGHPLRCHFCLEDLPGGEDDFRRHYAYDICPLNTRSTQP
eukprot:GHVR01068890.1.p1 GENE.GHVR01068890.1~~GHVR01068890.1.p1  ORF type:complete len:397 (+),score=89.97 GHVR01068890.1:657-1847(+)